jgi:hypothetical protein
MITVTKFKIGETVVTEPLIYCWDLSGSFLFNF